MSKQPVKVVLELGDLLTGRLVRMAEAAVTMSREWALRDATWEPHDWSEWP